MPTIYGTARPLIRRVFLFFPLSSFPVPFLVLYPPSPLLTNNSPVSHRRPAPLWLEFLTCPSLGHFPPPNQNKLSELPDAQATEVVPGVHKSNVLSTLLQNEPNCACLLACLPLSLLPSLAFRMLNRLTQQTLMHSIYHTLLGRHTAPYSAC